MTDNSHYPFLRQAIALAESAVEHGNHPFGAVLVRDGQVLLRAENTIFTGNDITNHAETNLVRMAVAQYSFDFLRDCILYTSTEPCSMCTGALYWSGISSVVFACSERRLTEITGGGLNISCRDVLRNASRPVTIIGPLLEEAADQVHKRYWVTQG
jgi:tRNA(Arg) A34 adenosine deaminase TadA